MKDVTGLVGRDDLVEKAAQEFRKGRHIILTGEAGSGKSAVLEGVLERVERRRDERQKIDSESDVLPDEEEKQRILKEFGERRKVRTQTLVFVVDHQPKGQFISIARRLLEVGILPPESLDLSEKFQNMSPAEIQWSDIKRQVNRLSIRDLTGAIVPAIHDHDGKIYIAVDDLTDTTPTLVAFWLAILEKAQLIGCASQKKKNLSRLWWKLTEIEVPPLPAEAATAIVRTYVQKTGMLIEAPELFFSHVVAQSGGNPQAIADMLTDSGKERVVDKRKIREMKHAAGVRYLDFTPVMIIAGAGIVGARYVAMGMGDTALYVLAGLGAALFMALRVFLARGAGKAN